MRVKDILQRKSGTLITIREGETIGTAVRLLMHHGIGGLAVVDADGALTGFIGERDIVDVLYRHEGEVRHMQVARVMRRAPACNVEDDVIDVMARMTGERLRHLVAVDQDRPVGVISVGDIVKQRLGELEMETGVLRDYVAAQRAV
jgi:CBS domain-containing protein